DLGWLDAEAADAADTGESGPPPITPPPSSARPVSEDALLFGDGDDPNADAAVFGTAAGATATASLTRRELHAREVRHHRRRRVAVALLVGGVVLVAGAGVAALASGGDSNNDAAVKVVGTELPSTTVTTRPVTTAPPTVAP